MWGPGRRLSADSGPAEPVGPTAMRRLSRQSVRCRVLTPKIGKDRRHLVAGSLHFCTLTQKTRDNETLRDKASSRPFCLTHVGHVDFKGQAADRWAPRRPTFAHSARTSSALTSIIETATTTSIAATENSAQRANDWHRFHRPRPCSAAAFLLALRRQQRNPPGVGHRLLPAIDT